MSKRAHYLGIYIPLNRKTIKTTGPRLVRFHDGKVYLDFGRGIRRQPQLDKVKLEKVK